MTVNELIKHISSGTHEAISRTYNEDAMKEIISLLAAQEQTSEVGALSMLSIDEHTLNGYTAVLPDTDDELCDYAIVAGEVLIFVRIT